MSSTLVPVIQRAEAPASSPSPHGARRIVHPLPVAVGDPTSPSEAKVGGRGEGPFEAKARRMATSRSAQPLTPSPEPRFARARGAGSCHRQLPNSPAPSAGRGEQQPGSTGETRTTRSTAHPQRSKNTQGLIPSPAQAKDRPAAKGAPLRACPACLAGQVQATGAGRTGGGQCSRYHCPTRGRPEARTSRYDVRSGR